MSTMTPTVPAACWEIDLATGMLALCPRSMTMFGLSSGSTCRLRESEWASRLHPRDLKAVREAMTASLVHRVPYAERFRTIHPDGSIQLVLGIGRPLESAARFVGWNFDVVSTGEQAASWISAHPETLAPVHLLASPQEIEDAPSGEWSADELLERAQSILRVRRVRERLLGRAIMGEPGFDLLLSLYVRSGQKETSLISLARPAGIAYSSAARWIRYLEDKGLVELNESRSDRRAITVQLTSSGRAVLDELLSVR
jgi:DNA-binding MarR family transcriptional regulator